MEPQKPSIGRIVHYKDHQAGAQAAVITAVCPNGSVPVCKSSVVLGEEHDQWSWPPRV